MKRPHNDAFDQGGERLGLFFRYEMGDHRIYARLNLAYRWFCRLGLDGDVPDQSTFSKNRHGRFRESDLMRRLFETILRRSSTKDRLAEKALRVDAPVVAQERGS